MKEYLPQKSVILKISRFFLVTILIFAWIFSGWPPIWQSPRIPPGIQEARAALPTFVAPGTTTKGAGAITPTMPSGVLTNDVLLLFIETSDQAITVSGGTETWTEVTGSPVTGAVGTRLTVFWARASQNTPTSPTTSDSGDHQLAIILAFRGVITSGNPWDVIGTGTASSGTSVSFPSVITTVADTMVVHAIAGDGPDGNSTANLSGETNANLTNLTEQSDDRVNTGNGGLLGTYTGEKATTGSTGNTTATLANAATQAMITIALKPAPSTITVGTTGTQTANMNIPSTNQYVGGAFTFVRNEGTANVTAITISETDASLVAQTYLSNVQLYYKTEAGCSASIPGDATLFNATGVSFDASENATITGDSAMAVGTSQICVYVELNVESGAPDADTFDIEITDPSTEVTVSAGVVSPATAVAISGATTLNLLPNVFIDHYRWRNDDGYEAGGGTVDVGNIRPDGDVSNQMTITDGGCTEAWCVWDDSVTQPTAPGTASDYAQEGTDNDLAEVNMTTIDLAGGTSPSITIWVYGTGAETVDLWTTDSINGQTTCATGAAVPDPGWVSGTCTFATAITQTALDGLTVTVRHNQLGGPGTNTYYAVYAQVDKTQTAATWATGAEDQALSTLDKNSNIRLRFQVDNTGGSASAYNYRLEWAAQSGGSCEYSGGGESYVAVPDTATTEHFDMTVDSDTYFSDGDPTTAQLSNAEAYTFVAGDQVESTSNQSGAITLANNQYTEVEYVFQANTNATDGGVYCFRVTNAGTALDSADVVAQVTLAGGGAVYSVSITPAGDIEYGFVSLSNSTTTIGSTYTKTATNDGDTAEKLNVKSSDATTGTTWTLASTIGSNQFKHEFSTTTGALWTVMPDSATYVTAKPSVAVSGTVDFDFRLTAPSSSDYQQKSITITVQAVAP